MLIWFIHWGTAAQCINPGSQLYQTLLLLPKGPVSDSFGAAKAAVTSGCCSGLCRGTTDALPGTGGVATVVWVPWKSFNWVQKYKPAMCMAWAWGKHLFPSQLVRPGVTEVWVGARCSPAMPRMLSPSWETPQSIG